MRIEDLPLVQAHRGYWVKGVQENTIAAFKEAAKAGARMIEFDVQLSKDNIPIVFHDDTIARFSNARDRVADLTAQQLAQLVSAPTLREVLQSTEIPLFKNIELKSSSVKDNGLEREVAKVVRSTYSEKQILFSSFNPLSLMRIKNELPNVMRALLVSPEKHPKNSIWLRKMWLKFLADPQLLHLDRDMVTLAFLRSQKLPVAVWTVNSQDDIQQLLDWGVVSVISDHVVNESDLQT